MFANTNTYTKLYKFEIILSFTVRIKVAFAKSETIVFVFSDILRIIESTRKTAHLTCMRFLDK